MATRISTASKISDPSDFQNFFDLPGAYFWLAETKALPRMLAIGLGLLGVVEAPGARDNPLLLRWATEVGGAVAREFRADSIPWCGLFVALLARRTGKMLPPRPLWARSWVDFGTATSTPGLGDVLVFGRPGGGGHVGLYVGEDATAYHVLGGNQSDRVSVARIARSRLLAARRPHYRVQPACVGPRLLADSGALSTDEA